MLKIRMLVILDLLQELSDEEHILNSKDLMTELSKRGYTMDRRSVYRDIEGLAEYGFDIVTTPKGFYLRNRRFTLAEVMLLISAVQAAPFVTESKTNALMKKLESFLIVSGHTHDGQIFPGNLLVRLMAENAYGHKRLYETDTLVSSGVGCYGPPLRIGTNSEIMVINVKGNQENE